MEILTASEVAAMLKISTRQVYELAKESENPIPSIRIRTSVRFRKIDVDGWVAKLVERRVSPPREATRTSCVHVADRVT